MNRIFLIIVFLPFIILTASWQENSMWLGGTLSLSGQGNGQTETRTTIMPELGYNMDGAWAVGARVGFSNEKSVLQGNTRRDNTTSIIPFARYTFGEFARYKFENTISNWNEKMFKFPVMIFLIIRRLF